MTDRSRCYVDASSNNEDAGPIDLAAYAAAGHKRISLKATEGTGYAWDRGVVLARQAHRLGLAVERYHLLLFADDPAAQAAAFAGELRAGHFDVQRGDRPMVDVEGLSDAGADAAEEHRRAHLFHLFMAHLAHELGHGVLAVAQVYAPDWYLAGKPALIGAMRGYRITASNYDATGNTPPNAYGLDQTVWQFTDRASVPGFAGPVDYNRELTPDPGPRPPAHHTLREQLAALGRRVHHHQLRQDDELTQLAAEVQKLELAVSALDHTAKG